MMTRAQLCTTIGENILEVVEAAGWKPAKKRGRKPGRKPKKKTKKAEAKKAAKPKKATKADRENPIEDED